MQIKSIVTFLIVNLIFKRQNLQTLTTASWQAVLCGVGQKWENFKLPTLIFCLFSRNPSRVSKENHISKKK